MAKGIRWFRLDRLSDLESRLADEQEHPRLSRRRDALLCLLGLAGLRYGEAARARADNLFGDGRLRVETEKGGDPDTVSIDTSVASAIWQWRRDKGTRSPILLPSNCGTAVRCDHLNAYAKRLFWDLLADESAGLSFHSLRHTFCMRLVAYRDEMGRALSPFEIQRLMRHRRIESTYHYVHLLAACPEECLARVDRSPRIAGQKLRIFVG